MDLNVPDVTYGFKNYKEIDWENTDRGTMEGQTTPELWIASPWLVLSTHFFPHSWLLPD